MMTKAQRRRKKIVSTTFDILRTRSEITLDNLVYELDRKCVYTINRTCVAMILAKVEGIEKESLSDSGRKFTVYTLK
jgi:hypothetical protein